MTKRYAVVAFSGWVFNLKSTDEGNWYIMDSMQGWVLSYNYLDDIDDVAYFDSEEEMKAYTRMIL